MAKITIELDTDSNLDADILMVVASMSASAKKAAEAPLDQSAGRAMDQPIAGHMRRGRPPKAAEPAPVAPRPPPEVVIVDTISAHIHTGEEMRAKVGELMHKGVRAVMIGEAIQNATDGLCETPRQVDQADNPELYGKVIEALDAIVIAP